MDIVHTKKSLDELWPDKTFKVILEEEVPMQTSISLQLGYQADVATDEIIRRIKKQYTKLMAIVRLR